MPTMPTSPVRQTVILAAGAGTRLGRAGGGEPKPLVTVGGLPLIGHALRHAHASGCTEAIVVIGHEGGRVRAAAEAINAIDAIGAIDVPMAVRFISNPDPDTPNGRSLLVAEGYAAERFYLQMVDHLFTEPVLPLLSLVPFDGQTAGRVLVDRAPVDLDMSDATKVRLANDRVTAIGKSVDPWDAIDAGCFVLTHGVFEALRAVPPGELLTVSSAMRQLAARGALAATELAGIGWVDVDTPADRDRAEQRMAGMMAPTWCQLP
jgi:choline kinase